ncbi:MAG: hypothetical protein ACRDE8_14415 [Ginsengibacter sp.]
MNCENGLKINTGIDQAFFYTITLKDSGLIINYRLLISPLSALPDIWIEECNGRRSFSIYADNMGLN